MGIKTGLCVKSHCACEYFVYSETNEPVEIQQSCTYGDAFSCQGHSLVRPQVTGRLLEADILGFIFLNSLRLPGPSGFPEKRGSSSSALVCRTGRGGMAERNAGTSSPELRQSRASMKLFYFYLLRSESTMSGPIYEQVS